MTLLRAGQAGRHHRHEPQGDRQPAQRRAGGGRRRRTSTVDAVQHGDADAGRRRPAGRRGPRTPTDVAERLDDGRRTSPPARRGCGRRSKMVDAVDVLFVDEAGQISLANVVAMARATDSIVLLGDPQQLDQPLQGTHPPGADRSALAHVLGGAATMPPTAACSSRRPGGCIRTCALHLRGLLRRPPRAGGASRRSSAVREPARARRRRRAAAGSTSPTVGADNESPDEADAVADLARALVDGGATWTDAKGVDAAARLGRRPDRRAVQRPGRRDPAAPADRGPGRHGRQVPGPGGADQHLLADDVDPGARAARDGLPVQPQPAERRDVARPLRRGRRGARRTCSASGPGRRTRCGWPTRSAASWSWRRSARPAIG